MNDLLLFSQCQNFSSVLNCISVFNALRKKTLDNHTCILKQEPFLLLCEPVRCDIPTQALTIFDMVSLNVYRLFASSIC